MSEESEGRFGPAKLNFRTKDSHVPVWARQFEANRRLYEQEMNEGSRSDIPEGLEDLARVMRAVGRR